MVQLRSGIHLAAIGLIVSTILIAIASQLFPYGASPTQANMTPLLASLFIGSSTYFALSLWLPQKKAGIASVWLVFLIGLAMRLIMFVSNPVMEDDWYRYLWDGAVVSSELDPYEYAPSEASSYDLFGNPLPQTLDVSQDQAALRELANNNPTSHSRINYPLVKTIYPPIAQSAFAASHILSPFDFNAWRTILLIIDCIGFLILLAALKAFNRSSIWAVLYWWNPVIITHGFGAGHMDVLLPPFIFAALWMSKTKKWGLAGLALSGAVGVKLWPILLAPIFLFSGGHSWKIQAKFALVFGIMSAVIIAPQAIQALSPDAGLVTYSESWRNYAFLFGILEDGVFALFENPGALSRLFVLVTVSSLTLYCAFWARYRIERLPAAIAFATLALVLLSPTGYPWYLIWIAALLPFYSSAALTSLVLFYPLYYLRFWFGDNSVLLQWVIIPIAFGIPIFLLIKPMIRQRLIT